MTAANIWVGPEAVYLLTDTAWYHEDGRVVVFLPKVAFSDRLNMAIASNGYSQIDMEAIVSDWLSGQPNQEAAMFGMSRLIARLWERMESASGNPEFRRPAGLHEGAELLIQLFVAMWSRERQQPEAWIIGSHQGTFPPPVTPRRLFPVGAWISPDVPEELRPQIDGGPDPRFDARRDGLRMIKAQRFVNDDRGRHVVGGCAELTIVDADGVRRELLHAWPDRVNRPIRPGPLERLEHWAMQRAIGGR